MPSTPPNTSNTPSLSSFLNHSNPVLSHAFLMIRHSSFICAIALATHTATSCLISKLVEPLLIPLTIIHLIHIFWMQELKGLLNPTSTG
jgi:hypothetical protein